VRANGEPDPRRSADHRGGSAATDWSCLMDASHVPAAAISSVPPTIAAMAHWRSSSRKPNRTGSNEDEVGRAVNPRAPDELPLVQKVDKIDQKLDQVIEEHGAQLAEHNTRIGTLERKVG